MTQPCRPIPDVALVGAGFTPFYTQRHIRRAAVAILTRVAEDGTGTLIEVPSEQHTSLDSNPYMEIRYYRNGVSCGDSDNPS